MRGFGQKSVNLTLDKLPNLELYGLDCLTGRPLGAIVNHPQNLHTIGVPLGGRHRAGSVHARNSEWRRPIRRDRHILLQ
jgi:hypothetical protein